MPPLDLLEIFGIDLLRPPEPFGDDEVHLPPRHLHIRPGHRPVDRRDARKRVRLDDRRRVGGRVGGVLQLDLLADRRADGVDPHAHHVHEHEHGQRDNHRHPAFVASQAEERATRHAPHVHESPPRNWSRRLSASESVASAEIGKPAVEYGIGRTQVSRNSR